jgi:hypothetical protein
VRLLQVGQQLMAKPSEWTPRRPPGRITSLSGQDQGWVIGQRTDERPANAARHKARLQEAGPALPDY